MAGLLACGALAWPAGAEAAQKGLETDMTWGVSSSDQQSDANALRDLGAQWTRMTVSWHDAEPTRGQLSTKYMGSVDRAVSLARGAGAQVLVDVTQSPQWASGSSDKNAPPQNPTDYANFAATIAQRYAGQASAIELWNEENLGRFWNDSPNPAAYAQLMKAAYPAVKSAAPGMTVLFGGMSTNDWGYLEQVYAAAPDIGHYFDVMATHPYDPPHSPDFVYYDGGRISKYAFVGYREVHQTMLSHGDDKPIWFTEFGWATTSQPGWGVSAQQQADFTRLAYQCVQQDPYVQVAILYELRNNYWAHDADDWEDQLGLLNTDWSHKPAYDAFKATDPAQGGCTYGDGSGNAVGNPGATAPPPPPPTTSKPAPSGSATASPHKVTVHVRRGRPVSAAARTRRARRQKLTVLGSVADAHSGRVLLRFERRNARGRWRTSLSLRVAVGRDGRFTRALATRSLGRWRVRAVYTDAQRPSTSRFAYFRI